MFDLNRWQEIYSTLRSNKLRTFLTAFGVAWGIFMLVVMLGSGTGLQNGVTNGMGDFATNSAFMWTQVTSKPYKGFQRGRRWNFNNGDTEALKKNIPELKFLAPRIQGHSNEGTNNVVRGLKTGGFTIQGDYPEWNLIDPVNILDGRFINQTDIDTKRKVAVIGIRVKEILFEPDENPMGQYIQIGGVFFKIVGVFKTKKNGFQSDQENQTIYCPFTTIQQVYNYGDIVFWYGLTSQDNTPVSDVEDKAISILKKRHAIAPDDDMAIGHFNVEKEFKKMSGLFLGINTLIWIVGIGTLIAGVIGVSNIMLVIVNERTKEFGIQRAIGATPSHIMTQIITESVVLTSIAGYFGLAAGVGVLELVNSLIEKSGGEAGMFRNPGISFNIAILSLSILVISGAVAGLIPAKRAVSIKPIDALRYE